MVPGDDQDVLSFRLEYFDLSRRTHNCLSHASIRTIGELAALRSIDVLAWPNAGAKTLAELRFLLQTVGLRLADDNPCNPPVHGGSWVSGDGDPELLARKIEEFDLSTRAANCLRAAGIKTVGMLAAQRCGDVLRWPNAGAKTVADLRALLGGLGLKFADHELPADVPDDQVVSDSTSLEGELHSIVRSVCTERNAEILVRLWGWNGKHPRTLDSVGREFGITRERVRQIVKRALSRLRKHRIRASLLQDAIAALKESVPGGVEALSTTLHQKGLSAVVFSPRGVRSAAQLLRLDWPFDTVNLGGIDILVLADQATKYRKLSSVLRRVTSQRGCANVLTLASELDLDEVEVPGLRRVLTDLPEVQWLDEEQDWLYSRKATRNRLQNLCAKVLGVAPRVHLSELRRAVSKARRLGMCPPQRVLGSFVQMRGLGTVNDSVVQALPGRGVPPRGSAEALMLEVLHEYGPIMDGDSFAERCISAGMNATTFYIYRTISPIVSALGKNVFCLVGAEVPPGTVEEIARRRRKQPTISDHGWSSAGRLWFVLQLSRQVITAGGIRVPVSVKDLVQGDWQVVLPDESKWGTVTCRDLFLWSARKAFAVLGAEPTDIAAFEFDLKNRHLRIRVGGQEVYDAIQHPVASPAEDVDEE